MFWRDKNADILLLWINYGAIGHIRIPLMMINLHLEFLSVHFYLQFCQELIMKNIFGVASQPVTTLDSIILHRLTNWFCNSHSGNWFALSSMHREVHLPFNPGHAIAYAAVIMSVYCNLDTTYEAVNRHWQDLLQTY